MVEGILERGRGCLQNLQPVTRRSWPAPTAEGGKPYSSNMIKNCNYEHAELINQSEQALRASAEEQEKQADFTGKENTDSHYFLYQIHLEQVKMWGIYITFLFPLYDLPA